MKEAIYSGLYALGQDVLHANNPCKIKDGRCMAGKFCCGGCQHLGPNGCTVEALSCKLWLCYNATCTPEGARTLSQFRVLKMVAHEHGVPLYRRASKEQTFSCEK